MAGLDSSVRYGEARGPDGVVIYAIGDVHGRLDLLIGMHETIAADIGRHGRDWRIVHLGDYADRGPDSKGVIERLASRAASDDRVLALAGNHDVGFLDFLSRPDPNGMFARYGGVQTARSYVAAACRSLEAAVPQRHLDFLRRLAFSASFGDFFFCHAGIRPGVALEAQDEQDLIWIRGEFHRHPGLHPKVIVHGHTPVKEADVRANRVNIDTGAFASGRLTALVIDGAEKRLLTVEG